MLHESIYCQGAASNWAAHAVRQEEPFASAFDALGATEAGRPVYFTGESVFPWMLEVHCVCHVCVWHVCVWHALWVSAP